MKLQRTKGGFLVTLLDFQVLDNYDGPDEWAQKIEFSPEGNRIAVYYDCLFTPNYWDIRKNGQEGEIFERPIVQDQKKYWLDVIEALRAEGASTEIIKHYIGTYEMTVRHEEQSKKLQQEIKNNIDNSPRYIKKVWDVNL